MDRIEPKNNLGSRNTFFSTIAIVLLAHYLAVFLHEYAHSITAWFLGFKGDPFGINYGGTNWKNVLFLVNIDEDVNYQTIFSAGKPLYVALIAFAGPGIGNGLGYLTSLFFLRKVGYSIAAANFLFWFNFMNLANFYDYVPIRTFVDHGDMGHLAAGLGVSHSTICIVLGIPVLYAIWYFFTRTLPSHCLRVGFQNKSQREALLLTSVILFFGYFGLSGYSGYGDVSHWLSIASVLSIPIVLYLCWPSRLQLREQIGGRESTSGNAAP